MTSMDALSGRTSHFLRSAPVKVRMAGFESTTAELQNHGWQISVEQFRLHALDAHEVRVAFRHDGIKQVALGVQQFNHYQMVDAVLNGFAYAGNWWKDMGIQISVISPLIQCHVIPMNSIPLFQAIDARPEFIPTQRLDLNDLAMFKPIKGENFEIYINQKDEVEILEILLKKQDVKKAEFLKNQKRRDFRAGHEGSANPDLVDHVNSDIKHQLVVCA